MSSSGLQHVSPQVPGLVASSRAISDLIGRRLEMRNCNTPELPPHAIKARTLARPGTKGAWIRDGKVPFPLRPPQPLEARL